MGNQSEGTDIGSFIRQIRGVEGELDMLVRLADELTNDREGGAQLRTCAGDLRGRIAELCRHSEKNMREAAVILSQLETAQEAENDAVAATVAQLKQRLTHHIEQIKASKRAVSQLASLGDVPASESGSRTPARKQQASRAKKKESSKPKRTRKKSVRRKTSKKTGRSRTAPSAPYEDSSKEDEESRSEKRKTATKKKSTTRRRRSTTRKRTTKKSGR